MTADGLRRLFGRFFADRGHVVLPSAGLIPHHPAAPLFTNAGMNQFLPYFLGEEPAPYARVTTAQKCVRVMGKHDDIENIGRSKRHLTFFEMLGNFSFGDYFKPGAIAYAWELITEGFGFDPGRLWVTVHESDHEALDLWLELSDVPRERIQKMGADNFWEMGETGPCGPCSEIYFDKGPAYGRDGGPAHGSDERFAEFWNLVFMQYDRQADGSLPPLPKQNIDTGAGFERCLCLVQNVDSVFDTDLLVPLVTAAQEVTGVPLGRSPELDTSLRILADHARSMTFLINDGVFPSNEDRGYVLRRIIRRAVRRAYSSMGVQRMVTATMVDAVVAQMAPAYPELAKNADYVKTVVEREEASFRQTLDRGLNLLETAISAGATQVGGDVAFQLHDTFGFPIEVTREVAAERGITVDQAGFHAAMAEQRRRAQESARKGDASQNPNVDAYRSLLDHYGPTVFVGDGDEAATVAATVLGVLPGQDTSHVELVLDTTPFYAEGGGQVGDTGGISTETGLARVVGTTRGAPGLTRHVAVMERGTITPGQEAQATIDKERRDAIRRNHTGTHLLHWALREVLGQHVKQQGSLVAPDELRFDFSHFSAMTAAEVAKVEELVNAEVLTNSRVEVREMSRAEAERAGAVAFFGEKYGDVVRVLDAGPHSRELCGGTHVRALGQIGPLKIVKEESVASNTRRVYALTGLGALRRVHDEEATLARAAGLLKAQPEEVPERIESLLSQRKALDEELRLFRTKVATAEASTLAAAAVDGAVVARRDGFDPDGLRALAQAVRAADPGLRAVVLMGSPDGQRVSLVASVRPGEVAADLLKDAAKAVGGGAGGKGDLAQAGGRDAAGLDAALEAVNVLLGLDGA